MQPYFQEDGITIYHGDCREIPPVVDAHCLVTDPPYGIDYRTSRGGRWTQTAIEADGSTVLRDAVLKEWKDKPALVFGSWKVPAPFGTKMLLVWDKGDHVGMGDLSIPWKPCHEFIYVLGGGFTGRRTTGVLRYNAPTPNFATQLHPTEKPLSLMVALIQKCPAGTILDPFAGSGSTLVAAKDLGRKAIGIEIEERYCEAAANRLRQGVLTFEAA